MELAPFFTLHGRLEAVRPPAGSCPTSETRPMLTETRCLAICDQVVIGAVMGGFRSTFHGLLCRNDFRPTRGGLSAVASELWSVSHGPRTTAPEHPQQLVGWLLYYFSHSALVTRY